MNETEEIMKNKKLMEQLRNARILSKPSKPYEPLVIDDCDHDWVIDDNFRETTEFGDEIISVPIVCRECGKEGMEVYIYSCYVDRESRRAI